MAFMVCDLVDIPALKTAFLAGRGGERRAIRWAHSCELAAPWEWLGRGDLLMTNGFTVPSGAAEQTQFVRQLEATGIAGIAIGQELHSPELSPEMLAEAERLGFPVLGTAYDVPFIAVAQAVAEGNRLAERQRMTSTMRIYEAVRQSAHDAPSEIVRRLQAEVGARLHIVDSSGEALLDVAPLEGRLREQVVAVVDERAGHLPAIMRVPDGEAQALIAPIPASEFACLVARPLSASCPELALLQHVAAVLAIEIERRIAQAESRRRLGSELLAHLIDRRIDAESGAARLMDFDLGGLDLALIAVDGAEESAPDTLHRRLRRAGVPNLLLRRSNVVFALMPANAPAELEAVVGGELAAGASAPVNALGQIPDAAREARWALEAARERRQLHVNPYGQQTPLFMPRTVSEARSAADAVLGGLLAYDAEHSGDLLRSLRDFLGANRSWQRAAASLGVHKQTLVYRMRRVEELTGKHLDDTGDVAQLWLALSAHDMLCEIDEPMTLQTRATPSA